MFLRGGLRCSPDLRDDFTFEHGQGMEKDDLIFAGSYKKHGNLMDGKKQDVSSSPSFEPSSICRPAAHFPLSFRRGGRARLNEEEKCNFLSSLPAKS